MATNEKAKRLRQLCTPGDPLVITNVWDPPTAKIVAAHAATKAIATASFAIAAVDGVNDNDMTMQDNLAGVRRVATVVNETDLPLTADMQDGYDDVAQSITLFIEAGAVGCNIEDVNNRTGELRSVEDAVERVKAAIKAAADAGIPDFCINARTDVLYYDGTIQDAIARGRKYLDAGATTIYIWGGPKGRGVSRDEVTELVKGLGGMINVKMNLRPGFLTRKELAELGVARISIGPELYNRALDGVRSALDKAIEGANF